jgi:XTP/dITP diphosphohydrolase
MKILIATHNASKLKEFRNALVPAGFEVVSATDVNLPDIDETGETFVENALLKARAAAMATGMPALADDSGLELPALDNFPGVITARFSKATGGYEKSTRELLNRAGAEETPAQYRCVLAMVWPDKREVVTNGIVKGRLVWPMRAPSEFGFDPWFVPEGEDRAFAQMTLEEKNGFSHRGLALKELLAALKRA